MKLVTFQEGKAGGGPLRLGALLPGGDVLHLPPGAALYLEETGAASKISLPDEMIPFLNLAEEGMELARRTVDFFGCLAAKERSRINHRPGGSLILPGGEVRLKAPVPRPGKIIALGLNFQEHALENRVPIPEIPIGFLKASSAVIGPDDPVPYPRATTQLDYELELAIVIGKKGKDIPEGKAFEHVAGYTIFNDLSARDIQSREMKKRLLLLGKNLDGFAPMGPYLATPEEVGDPHDLAMELFVNDESGPRQKSSTSRMIFKIPALVAYWSQMTLEPGDVITSGTPGGVALFRQPDPAPWFLKPGDTIKARIEGLGILRNPIV
ncbi:MAG: fumarylacetoacetate hydrolase family protein [Deltaproteobacteria bacterium]|nr:fumarylacetoacetate hydrolase family protein [Deltaproteobacteria bacterium]